MRGNTMTVKTKLANLFELQENINTLQNHDTGLKTNTFLKAIGRIKEVPKAKVKTVIINKR